jgi:tetratricopeptide (TPR) repeat protein
MKKSIFVFISVCLLLTIACSDNKHYDDILLRAEGLMKTNPDSSLAILNAADSLKPNFSLKQKMKYELLLTNAQNKTDVVFTSDSAAKRLVDYYDKHGTANEKMMANYLLGRVYMDMNKLPMALQCFQNAISDADTTSKDCDYYTLCRVYTQASYVFGLQLMPKNEIEYLELSAKYAWIAKDTITAINGYSHIASCYENLNNIDSIILISEKVASLYKKYRMKEEFADMIGNAVYGLVVKANYLKAKKYADYYIANSERFDDKGNIKKGLEDFYNTLGLYYMNTDKPDSAEYYFQKELREGKDYNNQILGNYGLGLLYQKTGKYELSSKHALRAFDIKDSAYVKNLAEKLQQIQSAYDYSHQQQIAEKEKIKRSQADVRSLFLVIVIMMLALIFYLVKKKRDAKMIYLRETYQCKLETQRQAEKDLIMLKSVENESLSKMIDEKSKLVEKLNNEIGKYKRRYKYNDDELNINESEIYKRFKSYAGSKTAKSPTAQDWDDLREWANKTIPNFYSFFISEHSLNNAEYEICILTRLGFSPSEISALKGYDKSSISTARRRIVEKITGEEGSAKMLDEIVKGN